MLCDLAAERAILGGICNYGEEAYLEIADLINESSFTIDSNRYIYRCLKSICDSGHKPKIDIASIYSVAQELSISVFLSKKEEIQHLKAIIDFPVNLENIKKFAAKVRKLEIALLFVCLISLTRILFLTLPTPCLIQIIILFVLEMMF